MIALLIVILHAASLATMLLISYRIGCTRTRLALWNAVERHIREWGCTHDDWDHALIDSINKGTEAVRTGPWVKIPGKDDQKQEQP